VILLLMRQQDIFLQTDYAKQRISLIERSDAYDDRTKGGQR